MEKQYICIFSNNSCIYLKIFSIINFRYLQIYQVIYVPSFSHFVLKYLILAIKRHKNEKKTTKIGLSHFFNVTCNYRNIYIYVYIIYKKISFVIQIIWKQWIHIIFQFRNREMLLLLVEYPVLYVNERVGDWQARVNDPIFIIVFCLEACGFPCWKIRS